VSVSRGVVVAVLIALGIVAYAWWLITLARRRGDRFFLPGFVTGVVGSLIGFIAAAPGHLGVGQVLGWIAPLGIVGSGSASRSVLKRLRSGRPLGSGAGSVGRTGFAYLVGLFVVLAVQLVVLFLMPPARRVEPLRVPVPSTVDSSKSD